METEDLMNVEGLFEFSVGQNVLVYFDGVLYHAKCMKRRISNDGILEYYVHYMRFKAKWDEWVTEDDVLEVNSINLGHKERLESRRKSCRKLKRTKKSQDPWTPEDGQPKPAEDASPNPAPRKRGRPKKILKPTAKPAVEKKAISDVQNEEISVVQNQETSVVQNEEISVVQNQETSAVQNEELSVVQNEEISVVQNEEISVVQNEETSVVQNEEISVVQNEEISLAPTKETSIAQTNEISIVQNEETSVVQNEEISIVQNRELSVVQNQEISVLQNQENLFVQNQGNLFVQNQENSFVQDQENLFVQNQENSFVQNQENLFVQNQENSFVQNQENSFVQNQEISVVQNQENSVVQNQVISLLQNLEVPSVEDKEAIQAFDNIVLKIVPRSMILSDKLRALRMPMVLKDTLYLDHSMHQSFNMLLKFPEENTVAKVLHMFTQSSYFLEVDNQKKYSIEFPVTLMKYFNATVHTHLTYRIEQLYSLRNKGMTYFQQKIYNQPIVNYFFKNQLYPKKIWCYLYGPMHLLRLLQHLPSILSINSWHPEYESDTFALHIERLLQFLAINFDTFFHINDFIAAEHYPLQD